MEQVVEWGPEIPVEDKQPDWLKNDVQFIPCTGNGEWSRAYTADEINAWCLVDAIRLPADHPHYHETTIDDLKDRCVALVRRMVEEKSFPSASSMDHYAEARAIMKAMEPVDVHEEGAKAMIQARQWGTNDSFCYDNVVSLVAEALRGRALERGE